MSFTRFMAIVKKEFIQIKRDRASLILAFVVPVIMLFMFGFAVKLDIENVEMAVWDQDNSLASRDFINKLKNTDYFYDRYYVSSDREAMDMIDKGIVKVAVIIPPSFEREINRGKQAKVQVLIDGSDSTISKTALSSSVLTANNYSVNIRNHAVKKVGGQPSNGGGIKAIPRILYNPEMESTKFTIPGLIGLVIQNITIILTAFALVRERERGTLEQLIITPIKPMEMILGKMLPYTLIGIFDFIVVLILAIVVFHMEIQGSLVLLLILSGCFVICALAMGMIISTVAKTQLQAMQMALLTLLPSVLLSGFVFPREAMPKIIYYIGYAIPLTYYAQIIRAIVLKGVGIKYFLPQVIMISMLTLLLISVAIIRFKKRLD